MRSVRIGQVFYGSRSRLTGTSAICATCLSIYLCVCMIGTTTMSCTYESIIVIIIAKGRECTILQYVGISKQNWWVKCRSGVGSANDSMGHRVAAVDEVDPFCGRFVYCLSYTHTHTGELCYDTWPLVNMPRTNMHLPCAYVPGY